MRREPPNHDPKKHRSTQFDRIEAGSTEGLIAEANGAASRSTCLKVNLTGAWMQAHSIIALLLLRLAAQSVIKMRAGCQAMGNGGKRKKGSELRSGLVTYNPRVSEAHREHLHRHRLVAEHEALLLHEPRRLGGWGGRKAAEPRGAKQSDSQVSDQPTPIGPRPDVRLLENEDEQFEFTASVCLGR